MGVEEVMCSGRGFVEEHAAQHERCPSLGHGQRPPQLQSDILVDALTLGRRDEAAVEAPGVETKKPSKVKHRVHTHEWANGTRRILADIITLSNGPLALVRRSGGGPVGIRSVVHRVLHMANRNEMLIIWLAIVEARCVHGRGDQLGGYPQVAHHLAVVPVACCVGHFWDHIALELPEAKKFPYRLTQISAIQSAIVDSVKTDRHQHALDSVDATCAKSPGQVAERDHACCGISMVLPSQKRTCL
mmetsp:Transcript_94368/g.185041  ORF Transcript_94368/g.185041 Transcript_94368/m.185041 type:complete len:245 (-) Transcript_94368:306-1040(-)